MLAEQLKVTKGTVVAAVRRLSEDGFLAHERYGSPALTSRHSGMRGGRETGGKRTKAPG